MIATAQNTEQNFDNFSDVLTRLDEFGLTPNQFRVYCHLWRSAVDGVVSESSESIAKTCKLTRITVLRVVSDLSKMNLIQCDRTPGKKSVFYLMPFSDWRRLAFEQKQPVAKQQSKVIPFKANDASQSNLDTCKADIRVKQINIQQEAEVPLKGTSALPANKPVNEIDLSTADTGSLDEKLAAARARGWGESGTWWNDLGQQMVTVNRFVVSVSEFMQRSLDSFDVGRQMCAQGLRMCKEQIEKIKQKKSQQLANRAMALAKLNEVIASQVDNQLEQGFCYG